VGFVASLWVRTSSWVVCGVMVEHEHGPSRNRHLRGVVSVVMAMVPDKWIPCRKSDSKPFGTS
jgi:hypothetical protein